LLGAGLKNNKQTHFSTLIAKIVGIHGLKNSKQTHFSTLIAKVVEIRGLKNSKQTHLSTLIGKKDCWNSWPPCNGCGFNLRLGHANVTYNRVNLTIW
jgi:hypothetical protein